MRHTIKKRRINFRIFFSSALIKSKWSFSLSFNFLRHTYSFTWCNTETRADCMKIRGDGSKVCNLISHLRTKKSFIYTLRCLLLMSKEFCVYFSFEWMRRKEKQLFKIQLYEWDLSFKYKSWKISHLIHQTNYLKWKRVYDYECI